MLFDFGDASTPDGKRNPTTVATQALFIMNSPLVAREAKSLAARIMARDKKDSKRMDGLDLTILDRRPDAAEGDAARPYLQARRSNSGNIDDAKAWQSLCHALMASNEFIYVY